MSKARGQSLLRAIRHGNACFYFDQITKKIEVCYKKGSMAKVWRFNFKNKFGVDEL